MVPGSAAIPSARPPILLVEDRPDVLNVLGILLDAEHIPYASAADGQQALDWLAGQRPGLVVLNWHPPRTSGVHLLSAIRQRHGASVPILVLSAPADGTLAQATGADAFLRKPFLVWELVNTIRELLSA